MPARHCLALAYGQKGDFAAARAELAAAAQAAETAHDPHAADLWGQAGNAALLDHQPTAAVAAFTSGLTVAGSEPVRLAALLTDRARALVEANRTTEAKTDLTRATGLDPSAVEGLAAAGDARPAAERSARGRARDPRGGAARFRRPRHRARSRQHRRRARAASTSPGPSGRRSSTARRAPTRPPRRRSRWRSIRGERPAAASSPLSRLARWAV